MRVGMIFECCKGGADEKVYLYLASQIRSDLEIKPFPLDSKGKLRQKCAQVVKELLATDKYEKVLIVWDFHPPQWGDEGYPNRKDKNRKGGNNLCPIEDRNFIENSLKEAKLTNEELKRVEYLCIVHELETLLLFDAQALSTYLSQLAKRPCKVKDLAKPGDRTKPKIVLRGIFESIFGKYGRTYNDLVDAEKIIKIVNIDKLKRCVPYQKFKKRILDL